ncbi:MAG: dihydroorotase [Burkholderiaceae bacterium]|nr:dihydroorotase [Burkholderiaceae bacterium]MCD8515844.1 dihydroorotase [Burkholderiaceae bacterium]MCD8565739.1 dihydroorotase [Burkholderiaceae bacterium]
MTQTLTITMPDDWHLHLRDGDALRAVVADSARQFKRAIIMPNLKPPVTTVEHALAYRAEIMAALQEQGLSGLGFDPLMTLYLTDNTRVEDIEAIAESPYVYAVKLYPAGATTNSDQGVTDLLGRCAKVLDAMQRLSVPLLMHGEVTDPSIDVFDREAVFIERVMIGLRRAYPALKVVFEHLTTKDGVDYVREAEGPIGATITPQHLLYNRNAIFTGGLRPHWYCLPVLKREMHRLALVDAATSDSSRFFLGTDSAPHARQLKEHASGCAGCYSALHAMTLYATVFDAVGKLDRLEAFASHRGPDFYGLPRNSATMTLVKEPYQVPEQVPFGKASLVPLASGETFPWRVQSVA